MIDKTAFYAMSYGLYLLTARRDGRDNGCIVDAVIQAASSPASVTISCMKENFTPEMIAETGEFNLSVLTENTPQEFFKHFGMQSGREADKFAEDAIAASGASFARSENGLIYTTGANAFVSCKVISSQDLGSHVQFTAEVTEAKTLSKDPSITYAFYRERLKKGAAAPAPAAAAVAASTSTAAPAATESTGSNAARTNASAEKNGENTMNKFICKVCGYIVEVEGELPEDFKCPVCGKDRSWFEKVEGELQLAAEHEYGVFASTVKDNPEISDEDKQYIKEQLMANFTGECSEVGMYLCMARIAHREGYPEVGLYWEKAAYEEAEHAAKFAELLGEELEPNMKATTKDNLKWRVECEFGATAGKVELATCAKKNGLDAIHDTVHEMARDEARHGKALKGLLERYFG